MAEDQSKSPSQTLPLAEAARSIKLPQSTLRSLIDAGYLRETPEGVPIAELKSFTARNVENGAGSIMGAAAEMSSPEALMDALDKRTDELAQQAYDRFVRVIPDAGQWTPEQRATFIEQAKGRFSAILAVMSQGTQVDQALRQDLEDVGASAAWAGTSLPHLLLVLRISRDLLLHSALRMADQRNGRMNAALNAFSARMMPSIDRLTDALAEGFWNAKLDQQQDEWHRLASVIEGSSFGVYEADLDGVVQYANTALAEMLGADVADLVGRPLNEIVQDATGAPLTALLSEPVNDAARVSFSMRSPRGNIAVDVDTVVRRVDGHIVGFGAIMSAAAATSSDTGLSALPQVEELRKALSMMADAGTFLDKHAEKMTPERIRQAGVSIRRQSERMDGIAAQLAGS